MASRNSLEDHGQNLDIAPLLPPALVTPVDKLQQPIDTAEESAEEPRVIIEMQPRNNKLNGNQNVKLSSEYVEGVTIEGEGEYQIIEVDDEEEEAEAVPPQKPTTSSMMKVSSKVEKNFAVSVKKDAAAAAAAGVVKLTREEERAVALEQMELLKSTLSTRKTTRKIDKQNKQEKELVVEKVSKVNSKKDLVNKIKAEWSDDDDDLDNDEEVRKYIEDLNKKADKAEAEKAKELPVKVGPISRRRPVTIPPGIDLQASSCNDLLFSGKRRRVIKRRIIWDPHVPETHFSKKNKMEPSTSSVDQQQQHVEKKVLNELSPKKNTKAPQEKNNKAAAIENNIAVAKNSVISRKIRTIKTKTDQTKLLNEKLVNENAQNIIKHVTRANSKWDDVYADAKMKALIVRSHSNSSFSSVEATTETEKKSTTSGASKQQVVGEKQKVSFQADCKPKLEQDSTIDNPSTENENTFIMPAVSNKRTRNSFLPWIKSDSDNSPKDLADNTDPRIQWLCGNTKGFVTHGYDNCTFYEKRYQQQLFICMDYKISSKENHPNNYTMCPEAIKKLASFISMYSANKDLRTLILWSKAKNFNCGIDYSGLIHKIEKYRVSYAEELGLAIQKLFRALATCPKPLIVGINGKVQGFGLTMLPLFDLVIAKSNTELSSLHSQIGQLPEGYSFWSHSNHINDFVRKRLFYYGDTVNVNEIFPGGFVHKICKRNWTEEMYNAINNMTQTLPNVFILMKKNQNDNQIKIIPQFEQEMQKTAEQWNKNICIGNLCKIDKEGYKIPKKGCLDCLIDIFNLD